MKQFIEILFGGAILSYALSTIAMDPQYDPITENFKNTKKLEVQQPLKFKVDLETGLVEDAEGSHLILQYRSAVKDLCKRYGTLRDEAQSELNDLEVVLREMPKDSDEYFATGIYKNKLISKISKFQKKASDIIDQEVYFKKVLTEIYKSSPSHSSSGPSIGVPNYEAIAQHKFKDVEELDFYINNLPSEQIQAGKHCFVLQINGSFFSSDVMNGLFQELQFNGDNWKLIKAQGSVFKKSKLIYHLSTKTEQKLSPKERFSLQVAQDIAEANKKNGDSTTQRRN
jgi:hypothetical protein